MRSVLWTSADPHGVPLARISPAGPTLSTFGEGVVASATAVTVPPDHVQADQSALAEPATRAEHAAVTTATINKRGRKTDIG